MKAESVQKKMRCLLFILSLLNFFHGDKISSRDHLNSVNALSRAYFISTRWEWRIVRQRWHVSMPCLGLTSFLRKLVDLLTLNQKGVNALSRAYFISTVPSGNPLFMRLPSPIFASNSQNILKISFFRTFFGLLIFIPIKTN